MPFTEEETETQKDESVILGGGAKIQIQTTDSKPWALNTMLEVLLSIFLPYLLYACTHKNNQTEKNELLEYSQKV